MASFILQLQASKSRNGHRKDDKADVKKKGDIGNGFSMLTQIDCIRTTCIDCKICLILDYFYEIQNRLSSDFFTDFRLFLSEKKKTEQACSAAKEGFVSELFHSVMIE